MKWIRVFDGNVPLYIRFSDTGKLMRAPNALFIDYNEVLDRQLREILGAENVALIS